MRERSFVLIATAVAATVLAGGCATIPSSGTPVQVPPVQLGGGAGGTQDCCVPVLRAPQVGWGANELVQAFLTASALDQSRARQYLSSGASEHWRPGAPVIILKSAPTVSTLPGRSTAPGGSQAVVVKGQQIAKVTGRGRYVPSSGPATKTTFTLEHDSKNHNLLLIASLTPEIPGKISHELFLTNYFFQRVYTARNLYFVGGQGGSLVPAPVFVPAGNASPATELIDDLLDNETGWLQTAVQSSFPQGSKLAHFQVLPDPTGGRIATVDIALPKHAKDLDKQAMAAELTATLTTPAYDNPALFRAVKFKIDGVLWAPRSGNPVLDMASLPQGVAHWAKNSLLYYLTPDGNPRMMSRLAPKGTPLPGDQTAFSRIAVAPGGKYFAGLAGPDSTVYTSPMTADGASKNGGSKNGASKNGASKNGGHAGLRLHPELVGDSFTSLSWDGQHNLWVAGHSRRHRGLWVLLGGSGPPFRVVLPSHHGRVTAVRIAPDGVRIALIVGRGPSARLVLGAITLGANVVSIQKLVPLAPQLTGVTSLAWYDDDHLVAVTRRGSSDSLWNVPANGDDAKLVYTQSGMAAVSAAGPENPLYLSFANGPLEKSTGLGGTWSDITAGRAATYPG